MTKLYAAVTVQPPARTIEPVELTFTATEAKDPVITLGRQVMSYDNDNVFAKILRGELPAERVYEDEQTLAIMDIMPRADGHTLVIPKTPARNMLDASPEQLAACLASAQKIARALIKAFNADGITLQQFNEAAGGQEVFHLHYHVLPRHDGRKLRAPGQTAEPEAIKASAEKIRAALAS